MYVGSQFYVYFYGNCSVVRYLLFYYCCTKSVKVDATYQVDCKSMELSQSTRCRLDDKDDWIEWRRTRLIESHDFINSGVKFLNISMIYQNINLYNCNKLISYCRLQFRFVMQTQIWLNQLQRQVISTVPSWQTSVLVICHCYIISVGHFVLFSVERYLTHVPRAFKIIIIYIIIIIIVIMLHLFI